MNLPLFQFPRYKPITPLNLKKMPQWERLSPEIRESFLVVSSVLPFRSNEYVCRELIDWEKIPSDPIFQLTFPQREMLNDEDYESLREVIADKSERAERLELVAGIRNRLNPHPGGQLSHNVPELDGRPLAGVQHKYRETVLFFPSQGQTCHAYCTYCFRWPQFVGIPEMKLQARSSEGLVEYLRPMKDVSDILFTGGDPLVMKTRLLERYVRPLLSRELEHVHTLRIGTKSLAYWPARFTSDPDADDLLRLFEEVITSGRHLALMAHFSHPRELGTETVRKAIGRIRATGAEIRMQAPLVKHVNDQPEVWSELWRQGVRLGLVPYYMFIERQTGANKYFQVPLYRAFKIYRAAYTKVSGLARTVRGPSMSAFPGKIQILGTTQIGREKVFVLSFLQGRDPEWVGRPFFAEFDPQACWLDQLRPAFGRKAFFFEREQEPWAVSTVA